MLGTLMKGLILSNKNIKLFITIHIHKSIYKHKNVFIGKHNIMLQINLLNSLKNKIESSKVGSRDRLLGELGIENKFLIP